MTLQGIWIVTVMLVLLILIARLLLLGEERRQRRDRVLVENDLKRWQAEVRQEEIDGVREVGERFPDEWELHDWEIRRAQGRDGYWFD